MEYRLLMFLQNSIRGPVQNKIMWCITSLENAGFLSIAACLALLLQPHYRRVGQAATVSMILEFMLVNLVLKNWIARVRPYHLLEDLILLAREPIGLFLPVGTYGRSLRGGQCHVYRNAETDRDSGASGGNADWVFQDLSGRAFSDGCAGRRNWWAVLRVLWPGS